MAVSVRVALVLAFLAIAVSASSLSNVERLMNELNAEQKEWVQRMRGGKSANFTEATHLPICRDLVIPDGVPCEEFSVQTEDGFQLNLIHLPPLQAGAPVVYLQHGLLSAASVWVDQDDTESLGYILRNQGYDVWAGNSRGNWYSLQNANYPVTDRALWDSVDFDTMAQYDLPAFINFILSTTGKSTLAYIGHSQGTTQAFAAFSQGYGNLCSQVSIFIAMAPVSRCMNIQTKVFQQLANLHADSLVTLFGWASWPPLNMDAMTVLEKLNVTCDSPDRYLCENIVYDIGGATQSWVNQTQMREDLGFDPAGTSMHNMQHWLQGMRYDGFRMYNYGVGNLAKYGQLNPPVYNLNKVCVPMAIFSGGLDELAVPVDVQWTISQLPADKIHFQKVIPTYKHNDFVWSLNAKTELYPDVIAQLEAHLPGAALAKANTLLNINKEKKN